VSAHALTVRRDIERGDKPVRLASSAFDELSVMTRAFHRAPVASSDARRASAVGNPRVPCTLLPEPDAVELDAAAGRAARPREEEWIASRRASARDAAWPASPGEIRGVDRIAVECGHEAAQLGLHLFVLETVQRRGDLRGLALESEIELPRLLVGRPHLVPLPAFAAAKLTEPVVRVLQSPTRPDRRTVASNPGSRGGRRLRRGRAARRRGGDLVMPTSDRTRAARPSALRRKSAP
jgi:hypothetical protein